MRYDQVVMMLGRRPGHDVLMEESDPICALRQFTLDALPRHLQHTFARVDAIDLHLPVEPQQFPKESSIPLTYDERTPRDGNLSQARDPTALQVIAKGDLLERAIPGRQRVEAHAFITSRATNAVSRTRSASATR
jgi:hypothetical protein